ncbi:hypothetical protein PG994_009724 [Apiospora phragmitis]|uniref:Uncharacterized protein n=1 Tax=Apiospora phragmitis TaxID=2905665 RepID=A0ABR1U6Y4_9PEZI
MVSPTSIQELEDRQKWSHDDTLLGTTTLTPLGIQQKPLLLDVEFDQKGLARVWEDTIRPRALVGPIMAYIWIILLTIALFANSSRPKSISYTALALYFVWYKAVMVQDKLDSSDRKERLYSRRRYDKSHHSTYLCRQFVKLQSLRFAIVLELYKTVDVSMSKSNFMPKEIYLASEASDCFRLATAYGLYEFYEVSASLSWTIVTWWLFLLGNWATTSVSRVLLHQ